MQLDEIKSLVRDIQSLIASELSVWDEPDIMQLAAAHEETVRAVIQRAESVADLLDRGLNNEAIQLAEREPGLAALAMVLDFPELAEWTGVLAEFKVAPVPEMPHDTIAQLEDAYSTTADSKQLLQRFRGLSLARAPLAERIDVLRRLSEKDPENDQWKTGIKSYETYRLKSITKDLKAATEKRDLSVVARIDREVNQAQWAVPVPPALKKDAQSAHRKLKQAEAREKLKPVADSLSLAYAEFNVPQATQILPRFQALMDIANLPPDHEIMDVAGPAVEWIEGELEQQRVAQERQQAIANLQIGLDRDAPLAELEQHYYKATENGEPVPQVLETRIGNKIAETDATAKRKKIGVVTGSIVGLSLVTVAFVWFFVNVNFNTRVKKNVEQITQLLEDASVSGNTAPLESRLEELALSDAAILETPEVAALRKKLEALKTAEDGRIRSFNSLLTSVSAVTVNPEWVTLQSAEDSLDKANQLTKNENERAAVLEAKREFDTAKAGLRKQTDKRFTDELDSVSKLMVNREDAETYKIPLERLTAALKSPNISSEVEIQGRGLLGKLTTARDLAEKNRRIELDLAAIGRNADTIFMFKTAMAAYARNHSGSRRANELEEVQRLDSKLWDSVNEWGNFKRKMPTTLSLLKPNDAKSLLADFEEVEKSGYPGAMIPELQKQAIEAIARRTTSLTGTEPEIGKLFDGQFMRDCFVIKLSDRWYYGNSVKPPRPTTAGITFDYFKSGFSDAADGNKAVKIGDVVNQVPWRSAQSSAALLIDEIITDKELDFEQKISSVMGLLLNAKDMDPILQLLLVENILSVGGFGSAFIQQETLAVRDSLAGLEVPRTADWVNPDKVLTTERGIAERGLEAHADLVTKALAAAIKSRDATFVQPVGPTLQLAGWIHRDKSDLWRITLYQTVQPGSDLFMLYLLNGKPESSVVGRTSSGETILTGFVPDASLREGRPVYIAAK